MSQNEFRVKISAPYFRAAPVDLVDNWGRRTRAAAEKAYQANKRAIRTNRDFEEKIARPLRDVVNRLIRQGKKRTKAKIMSVLEQHLQGAARRYRRARELTYRTDKFQNDVEAGKQRYAAAWLKFTGPLLGYNRGGIKGLAPLAALALTGAPGLAKFLKPGRDRLVGIPFGLTAPERAGRFKKALLNQLNRSGTRIILEDFRDDVIREENEAVNRLVESYRLPEIAPFSPGGASYVNFIVETTADPAHPDRTKSQVALDIRVTRK